MYPRAKSALALLAIGAASALAAGCGDNEPELPPVQQQDASGAPAAAPDTNNAPPKSSVPKASEK